MTGNIKIDKSVLDWIQSTIQITDLPENMQTQFKSWYDGSKGATKRQIQEFSKKTHIPFGYFFRKKPPKEEFPFAQFRTVNSQKLTQPSRELIDTYKNMAEIKDWMSEYLEKEAFNRNALSGKFRDKCEFKYRKEVAAYARDILDPEKKLIGKGKKSEKLFTEFRKALSDEGILVMANTCVKNNQNRKLDTVEFRGMALMDEYAPLIFINRNDSPSGQLFTLLHEFAHILIGTSDLFNASDDNSSYSREVEKIANAIAAEIILPDEELLKRWDSSKNSSEGVSEIAKIFGISTAVAARKAFDNNLISKETFLAVSRTKGKPYNNPLKSSSSSPHVDFYTKTRSKYDNRFLQCLNVSLEEGSTTYSDMYSMTGMKISTFQTLMDKIES